VAIYDCAVLGKIELMTPFTMAATLIDRTNPSVDASVAVGVRVLARRNLNMKGQAFVVPAVIVVSLGTLISG
jgi:hypothetical protein